MNFVLNGGAGLPPRSRPGDLRARRRPGGEAPSADGRVTMAKKSTTPGPRKLAALDGRLRAALKRRGLMLKRDRLCYAICDLNGETLVEGLSLDNVGNFVRRRGYRGRGERAREASARMALAAKGYKLRRGRGGLVVKDANGGLVGYPLSLSQVEMFVAGL